ncbi:nitrite reductase large subunit NirB [Tengunoibacter tsumagoiensis]|uniref:Nitrite reductase [NAD(P)H] n=1 Tax=Tengunoibacter tsumagoiensis TaxID=2014871 RepID=A0A401ZYP8_9CHLR|nr:nitrite reductase large subunit NirB [Tengunoibacter tsumagoiensis]GCE11965.1 nitrite reductase [NAD(P)H] [Tengunoibacter tsumagoiensis]
MTHKQRLVIIGNGMAGARLVEEVLARQGSNLFEIIMFGAEPYGNYNRILLSGVLAGTHDPKDIFINPLSWYEENNITLHAGKHVSAIDPVSKVVLAGDDLVEPYDKLVIATGSKPFVPALENLSGEQSGLKDGIFVFRTMDDCQEMVEYASHARKAVIVGGGLLGLEAARGLLNRGLEVHVAHVTTHLMNVQLDPSAGKILQKSLESMGVHLHLKKRASSVLGNGHVTGLAFQDGSLLDCDMLVISTGIRPNIELACQSGLAVDQGILVEDDLSCKGMRNIYALGECIQHRGQTYGLVSPIWEQAQVLAERLVDEASQALYQGSQVSTKLKVMGVELAIMGEKDPYSEDDEVVTYAEPGKGIYKKLIIHDNRLVGATLMGDGQAAPRVLQLFDRKAPLPENRAELLFSLAGESKATSVADLPDSAQICNCNGVTKGKIIAGVKAGKRSLKVLCDFTRAGTGCGACKSQVQEILEQAAGDQLVEDPSIHYYVPGVALTKPELIKAIREQNLRSVSAVFMALAHGKEDPASKLGLASLLKIIWGKDYEDERDARFINDRVHANIQHDGTFSVVPRIYGGVTSAEELRRIADVAEKYRVPMVKITGGQRIDLLGIEKEQLPQVWQDLGMPSGHAYTKSFRTCKTCVGTDFCRFGVGDSTALGIKIEKRFQGIESPHKMKLAVSGCPRNCAEATIKDLGAVAIEGGKWEIFIGGAAGASVRKGDVLCIVDSQEKVLQYMGRFMQYYRENARYLERTYGLVQRMGIERLRQILIDDVDGICERLDRDMQAAVEAYKDPWQEAIMPHTPGQFTSVVETISSVTKVEAL